MDTAIKRHSALAQRYGRLPFGRRFLPPLPDQNISAGDRQTLAYAYGGLAANVAVTPFYIPLAGDVTDSASYSLESTPYLPLSSDDEDIL